MTDRRTASDLTVRDGIQTIRPRLFLGGDLLVGPGKIDLLRAIHRQGSLAEAGRTVDMEMARAWMLLDELKEACGADVVAFESGARSEAGISVTDFGLALLARYDAIEAACADASRPHLEQLAALLAEARQ